MKANLGGRNCRFRAVALAGTQPTCGVIHVCGMMTHRVTRVPPVITESRWPTPPSESGSLVAHVVEQLDNDD